MSAPSAARNRRLNRRRPSKHRVKVACRPNAMDLGANVALSLLDLSETGARLMVKTALPPGREVTISLEGGEVEHPAAPCASPTWPGACRPPTGTFCSRRQLPETPPSYRTFLELSREPDARSLEEPRNASTVRAATVREQRHVPVARSLTVAALTSFFAVLGEPL